jgi:shikimate kinase
LDDEFCKRVRSIRNYLDEHGYASYVRRNSELFHELSAIYGPASGTVFVLSSGFLATDVEPETVARNRATVRAAGVSVLLMPSRDLVTRLKIVLARQRGRGLNLEPPEASFALPIAVGSTFRNFGSMVRIPVVCSIMS